jgi:hypothetical protein
VQARDAFDGDATLLIAPYEEATIKLELAYADSVVGCAFVGTFSTELLEIQGITPGDGWEGTDYTNRVFNSSYDNTTGEYAVFTSVTGVPAGLSGSGPYVMANVDVVAKAALSLDNRALSGAFAVDEAASGISRADLTTATGWLGRDLDIKLAYVGDIANTTTGVTGTPPAQVPNPDGYMNFADMWAFTYGWNGGLGLVQDPISDMGPFTGTSPDLIPERDHDWDVDDLLAFTGNWSWFSANDFVTATFANGNTPAFMPLGAAVESKAAVGLESSLSEPLPGRTLRLDVHVDHASQLSAAMVRVAYDPAELTLVGASKGEMLARDNGNVMFFTVQREGVIEVDLGRLHPEKPGVSGHGVVASIEFRVTQPPETGLSYVYDLRGANGAVIARGANELTTFGQGRLTEAVLCQNYPNPLNPATSIVFMLPSRQAVDLAVYDLTGRRLKTLVSGPQDPGVHTIEWNGLDQGGNPVASGVYFYKMHASDVTQTRKLVITR